MFNDGCTFWPDRIGDADLLPCCDTHDMAYAAGGTREDRLKADRALRACVGTSVGGWLWRRTRRAVAAVMYAGVRVGGHRAFHYVNPKHWGNDWPVKQYGTGYGV